MFPESTTTFIHLALQCLKQVSVISKVSFIWKPSKRQFSTVVKVQGFTLICSCCQSPRLYYFTPCSALKHACVGFTGFGYCSVSTLTSKKSQSAQWKVKVVGPCVQSDKDSRDGRDTGPHSAHNNVTEWNNESMEKTHNLHYKRFGIRLYDTCDWRAIMYSLIPSSSQPSGGLMFAESTRKQGHIRFNAPASTFTFAVLIMLLDNFANVWTSKVCMHLRL